MPRKIHVNLLSMLYSETSDLLLVWASNMSLTVSSGPGIGHIKAGRYFAVRRMDDAKQIATAKNKTTKERDNKKRRSDETRHHARTLSNPYATKEPRNETILPDLLRRRRETVLCEPAVRKNGWTIGGQN